ncbi:hypothetical protein GUJ93_ZPchr0001g32959 [Zizania palustris]|uniref:Uncharacterized protein n=1 Tax=Zizania palustris TaxID=103762 RepID=A0A8J5RQG5_ZIZPA|nr:hypothetical protein GUJ93_ZPchr0001g32959 [Zizania palustris]
MNEAELVQHQARAELGRMMRLTSPRPGPVREIVVRLQVGLAQLERKKLQVHLVGGGVGKTAAVEVGDEEMLAIIGASAERAALEALAAASSAASREEEESPSAGQRASRTALATALAMESRKGWSPLEEAMSAERRKELDADRGERKQGKRLG